MINSRSAALALAGAMLMTVCMPGDARARLDPLDGPEMGFDQRLELARELNATEHWRSGRSILDQLEPELARATPRQRNQYDLTLALNLGLSGSSAAGVELIDQVLARQPDATQRMNALWLAANLASAERSYRRAFSYIREGLDLMPEVDDPAALAGLLGMAGRLYAEAGQIESGIEMARQAVEYAGQVPNDRPGASRCIAAQRLTVALRLSDQHEALFEAARQALDFCKAEENAHFVGNLESLLGQLTMDIGELELAEQWLRTAERRQQSIGHLNGLLQARLRLIELDLHLGRAAPPAGTINRLINDFRDRRWWEQEAELHQLVARFAERDGDYGRAVDHLRRGIIARERLDAWVSARRQAYMDILFDMHSRRQELALLQEQSRVHTLEATTARQEASLRRTIQAGSALVIGTLILLLFRTTRQRRHYRALSQHDGLTDLLNHTAFFEAADAALNDCLARRLDFTLVVGDIDHFKRINDSNGHLAGDTVLQRVAGRMREQFPPPAIIGRVGGEEFAIALPGWKPANAEDRVRKLRDAINTPREGDESIIVTLSYGIAGFDRNETIERLRRRADQALYEAKATGRDRIVLSGND
jgi:diguanylate cyclase (GGDEF)-like protein